MENPPARQDPPLAEGRGQQRETDQNPSHGAARRGKLAFPPRFPTRPPPLLVLPLPSANPATPPTIYARLGLGPGPLAESMARAALRLGARALALLVLVSGAPASLSARLNSALRLLTAAVLIERFIRWDCFGAARSLSWETYLPRIFALCVD